MYFLIGFFRKFGYWIAEPYPATPAHFPGSFAPTPNRGLNHTKREARIRYSYFYLWPLFSRALLRKSAARAIRVSPAQLKPSTLFKPPRCTRYSTRALIKTLQLTCLLTHGVGPAAKEGDLRVGPSTGVLRLHCKVSRWSSHGFNDGP